MSDIAKTILAIAIAAALAAGVWLTGSAPVTDEQFSDEGELFFPEFTDPLEARQLEVVAYDEETAFYRAFKVEFRDNQWVIPSHHNYPADAEENMASAAAVLIGLTKAQVITDRAAEHEELGVLAPDDDSAPVSGRGVRVTFADGNGSQLASLIIGRTVGNAASSESTRRYVRLPDRNRVYAADFAHTFSTDFADWVETDPLQLTGTNIDRYEVDRYSVDEARMSKSASRRLLLTRSYDPAVPTSARDWSVTETLGDQTRRPDAGQAVDADAVAEAINAAKQIRISGVRPKPERLAEYFAGRIDSLDVQQFLPEFLNLQSHGFFLGESGQLLANEGQVRLTTREGIVYELLFGEVLYGSGRAVSAGIQDVVSGADGGEASEDTEFRYMFVDVAFAESMFPEPIPPASPPAPSGEEGSEQSELAEYERLRAERDEAIASGRARVAELRARFAKWYYVIDAAGFDALRPAWEDVVGVESSPDTLQPQN